jgi:hypothetical protein
MGKHQNRAESTPLNEHALIGAVLLSAHEAVPAAMSEGISAASFTDAWCQTVWASASRISSAGGIADIITILDDAGLSEDLFRAECMIKSCATVEYAAHYARAVRAEQARSDIRSAAMSAVEAAESGEEVASILEKVKKDLESIEDQSRIAPIVSGVDFAAIQMVEPPQVIHGIIRAGQVGMMAASSKAGKSWALLALGMAAATGTDWMGCKTTPGRVLYINAELSRYDLQRRIKELAFALGLPAVPDGLDLWHKRGENQTIGQLIPEVLRRQRAAGAYSLLIPDPLYCFGGGRDENDNAEQAKTMGEMSEMAERTSAAVWVAHHFSKGNKRDTDHLDRASGAGMFARAVDTFMTLTRHEEDNAYTVETTTRSFAKPDKFVVRWEFPIWTMAPDLDPEELKKPNKGGRPAKYTTSAIAAEIEPGGNSHGGLYEACRLKTGISKRHFNNLVHKAIEDGLIKKSGESYVRK